MKHLGYRENVFVTEWLLGKPRGLYPSSFNCLSRFARGKTSAYLRPNPYPDYPLLSVTDGPGQVEVEEQPRHRNISGGMWRKLLNLWVTVYLQFSPVPARSVPVFIWGAALGSFWRGSRLLVLAVTLYDIGRSIRTYGDCLWEVQVS